MNAAARRVWTLAEPFHALTYFAPECHAAFEAAGLRGFWRGYFAGRAAPLGVTSAAIVTATFFGFHPDFVGRAVPSIWTLIEPGEAIEARLEGIDRALRDRLASELSTVAAAGPPTRSAPRSNRSRSPAVRSSPRTSRLRWPDAPHLALWHAVTLLREHRGDGHVSVLTAAGVHPCEAHMLRIADDGLPLDSIRPYRGWDDEDWATAAQGLRTRGWLDDDGRTTFAGARARADIEADTDRLSREVVDRIANIDVIVAALGPIADRLEASAMIPYPNPIGVPRT